MAKGPDYHNYTMTDLKEETYFSILPFSISVSQFFFKFSFPSSFQSHSQPLFYGKVYISDIVAQLCELEGWKNPKIVSTTATDYKDSCLDMGGVSALEYISTTLCENAVEAGGLGRELYHNS